MEEKPALSEKGKTQRRGCEACGGFRQCVPEKALAVSMGKKERQSTVPSQHLSVILHGRRRTLWTMPELPGLRLGKTFNSLLHFSFLSFADRP